MVVVPWVFAECFCPGQAQCVATKMAGWLKGHNPLRGPWRWDSLGPQDMPALPPEMRVEASWLLPGRGRASHSTAAGPQEGGFLPSSGCSFPNFTKGVWPGQSLINSNLSNKLMLYSLSSSSVPGTRCAKPFTCAVSLKKFFLIFWCNLYSEKF